MLRKFLMTAGLAAAFAFSAHAAEAKVKVFVGIGGYPGGYCYDRYDPYRCNGGGYYPRPGLYDPYQHDYDDDYDDDYGRLSCSEARGMLRERGYRDIQVNSCGGRYYVFIARKHRHNYLIKVNAQSGIIRSVRPI